ncbi:MAG: hypothetical protein AAFY38_12630 [Pseudomonadota bacterium]
MTKSIDIPRDERGVIRVFSLSMTPAEAKALRANIPHYSEDGDVDTPDPQTALLGAEYLDGAFTEVFPISDLEGLGLVGYLKEGNGVDPAQLAPDAAKLAALAGWVFIVYSSAFGGFAQTLTPGPELTLIGTYGEPQRDYVGTEKVEAEAAKPSTGTPPAKKKRSDAAMSGMVATFVLVLLGLFTWLFIWIAG